MKHARVFFVLTATLVVLDQYTKYLALHHLLAYEPIPLTSFFNFTLAYNTGAAFSFLNSASGWQKLFFTGVASVVSVFLAVWLWRMPRSERWQACAVSLILAGALGNLIDRLIRGHVIDFLDFHWGMHHWPVFNLADSVICVGAAMLILELFICPKKG